MGRNITPQIENPFTNLTWHETQIDFALLLSKTKERILIGKRWAIRKQLDPHDYIADLTIAEENLPSVEVLSAAFVEKVHAVSTLALESIITNPKEGYRKYRAEIDQHEIDKNALICDQTYDLGHFIFNFEYDAAGEWEQAIWFLQAAKTHVLRRNAFEAKAIEILLKKWRSADPICQYAALRIWQEYLRATDGFVPKAQMLIRAFQIRPMEPKPTQKAISQRDPLLRLPLFLEISEEECLLWRPSNLEVVCALVKDSFIPLKLYYRQFLNAHSMKFRICAVCKRVFLSDAKNQKTCSKQCYEVRQKMTKARYDEKARASAVEKAAKNSYQYWYTRVKKARTTPGFPEALLAKIEEAFLKYKEESLRQKHLAKESENSLWQYRDWSIKQDIIIQNLVDEYE